LGQLAQATNSAVAKRFTVLLSSNFQMKFSEVLLMVLKYSQTAAKITGATIIQKHEYHSDWHHNLTPTITLKTAIKHSFIYRIFTNWYSLH
jgi:hypothetical protein